MIIDPSSLIPVTVIRVNQLDTQYSARARTLPEDYGHYYRPGTPGPGPALLRTCLARWPGNLNLEDSDRRTATRIISGPQAQLVRPVTISKVGSAYFAYTDFDLHILHHDLRHIFCHICHICV